MSASSCAGANISFSVPWNATITDASVSATLGLGSLAPSVGLNATFASSGGITVGNVTLLPGIAFSAYLATNEINGAIAGATSGEVDVVVAFQVCPAVAPFTVIFDSLNVTYWLRASPPALPPLLTSSPLLVTAASGMGASFDLAPFFIDPEGDPLNFSATVSAAWEVTPAGRSLALANLTEAGLQVSFNGSVAQMVATNEYWWGQALVDFTARDPGGNLTPNGTGHLLLDVAQSALAVAHAHVYAEPGGRGVGSDRCGGAGTWFDLIELPGDAYITSVAAYVDIYNGNTPYPATVELSQGGAVLDSFDVVELPLWVGARGLANFSGLTTYSDNASRPGPFLDLSLNVSVCGAWQYTTPLSFWNISVTYWTGGVHPPLGYTPVPPSPANGTGLPLPSAVRVVVNGGLDTTVEPGTPLSLVAQTSGEPIGAFNVTWSIDGIVVGHGPALWGLTLEPGEHTVEITVSNGTVSQVFRSQLAVAPRAPLPPGLPPTFLIAATLAGITTVGIVATRTQPGRWLILGVLLGSVFARLKKASLLDHFVRGTLYQVIRENPGIHFAELRRRTHLANGAATHHLRMLEKGAYLRVVIDGTKTRFFTTDRPMEAEVYGISDTDRAVLDAVANAPGISQGDLALKVDRSASVVSRSVARLLSLGFVTTALQGGRVQVFPRPDPEVSPLEPAWPDEGP